MSEPAIYARGLRKSYGPLEAVKGIDFEVAAGEVFGLLGPNGAGKTTTVEILEGLRPRTGRRRQSARVRSRSAKAGVERPHRRLPAGDESAGQDQGARGARTFRRVLHQEVDGDALLRRLQLWEKRDAGYATLSGGQKQRLALALALINDPQMLFLDEPTTGLDPQVRLEIRDLIEELRAEKRTILMTTHYIEEAERLCDRVAIIDDGDIIAIGSPRELQEKSATQSGVEISLGQPLPPRRAAGMAGRDSHSRERGPAQNFGQLEPAGENAGRADSLGRCAGH